MVRGVLDEANKDLKIAKSLGFRHTLFQPRGPFPVKDTMGMGIVMVMLQSSLEKAKYMLST